MEMKNCRGEVGVSKPLAPPPFCEKQVRPCACKDFSCNLNTSERKLVCVTSGNSYLGSHILKQLLARGHLVRVMVQNQVELEGMGGLLSQEEMRGVESVVAAKMGDLESLCNAFRGCHAVFHISSIDPCGVSGYSERMAFLETEGARNVIEACGRAAYVKRCIFTSSLLASIWQGDGIGGVIDECSWSDEEFCRDNKLWLALGKTTAEKIAWRKSKEMRVKLVTVCPGLLMAPTFPNSHIETSLPYLKGGRLMLQRGVLATANVHMVAMAHIHVYEAMDYGACGRYLCFNRVVKRLDEVIDLENGLKMHGLLSGGRTELSQEEDNEERHRPLSNERLAKLVSHVLQRVSCKW